MKKAFACIKVELKKTINSFGFIVSIIIISLLCFTSVVYTDSFNGKEYTVLEIIFIRNHFSMIQFYGKDILLSSVSPYLTVFLPILSSIPFVTAFCSERLSGNLRFTIIREHKFIYSISKFISAIVSGALSVMFGFILYSILICYVFGYDGTIAEITKICMGTALYGIISVLPTFFLSSFIKNKYIICCSPFILMHFYYTIISKIQDCFNSKDMGLMVLKMSFLYPDILKNIFIGNISNEHKIIVNATIYYSILILVSFLGFTIIMNRRFDNGQ